MTAMPTPEPESLLPHARGDEEAPHEIPWGRGRGRGPRFLLRAVAVVWSNRRARVGILLLALFVFVTAFAGVVAPYGLHQTFDPSLPPSRHHLLGTTNFGNDVFTQLLFGTRISLGIGLLAGLISSVLSVVVGLLMGYLRGPVEHTLGFLTNLALVIPLLPLMIVLATYLHGLGFMVFVLTVTSWAFGARVIRAQVATLRERDFIQLAQFSGESSLRIVFREVLPNMTSLVAVNFFLTATYAVLGEVGIEFIGLGDPSQVTWGTMLYWAQGGNALIAGQWGWLLAPGLCIALLAAAFSLINFGVDALSNPRLKET
jgi:peptide/nickel transport system permease protein